MKKILVAIDGSENSEKAILKAKSLAEALDSQVSLIYVINDTMINNPYVVNNDYRLELGSILYNQGKDLLENAKKTLNIQEEKVKTILEHGDPANKIISYAEENEYDLLIMGRRGLSTFSRIMLGSVSQKVINHIKISVLIVKC